MEEPNERLKQRSGLVYHRRISRVQSDSTQSQPAPDARRRHGEELTAISDGLMAFQELMRERFEEVIEKATGRNVIGFMSGNQQEPDLMCEVFVLDPSDLV